jgi:glycosyltransferase involved in cell wall biosynthesis
LVGTGPSVKEILSASQRDGLKNVHISGVIPLPKALELTAQSQVVVVPLRETLHTRTCCPTKLVQYSAMGKAIVTIAVSDVALALKKDAAAVVVSPAYVQSFPRAVKVLLKDPKRRGDIGERAKFVFENYDWEKISKPLLALYGGAPLLRGDLVQQG